MRSDAPLPGSKAVSNMNVPVPPLFHLDTVQSDILPDNGEYVLKVSIGTPPYDVYAIVDTGSDLFLVPAPGSTSCASPLNTCNYTSAYADSSLTKGVLATETLTFASTTGPPVTLPNIVFGCGHNNTGVFNDNEMGLAGLMRKAPPHLADRHVLRGQAVLSVPSPLPHPPTVTSKMSFGSGSERRKHLPAFNSSGASHVSKGNVFLDSGTPITIVPKDFYDRLAAEVKRAVELTPIDDPQLRPQLCYGRDVQAKGPVLTAHFDGEADVEWKQTSTFIEAKDGIFCFAMTSTDSPGGIIGNYAQTNYLIGFDLDANTISFKPTDCTKL
ncbi:aspartic proteinase CDR1-like [Eucalyptus grandis]|uniref:aspartic proteinase CDR1-like n=1 Tax=Eucalyptus grandis TaxID=71139 RepID=UPI00192EC5CF|nr:aspartic proteinase CDR1-like [Eucalyptus grandis]